MALCIGGGDNYKNERLAGSLCCLFIHVNSIAVLTRGKQTVTFTFSFILEFLPRMHNLDSKNGTTFVTLFPFLVPAIISYRNTMFEHSLVGENFCLSFEFCNNI